MDILLREQGVYRFGPFVLDPARRALMRDDVRIKLAERLFDALLYLVVNQGRLVERDEFFQAVWADRVLDDNNVSQAIFSLRKALIAAGGTESYIITVPSRGFRFAEPVRFEPAPPEAALPHPPAAPKPEAARSRIAGLAAAFVLLVGCGAAVLWQSGARPSTDGTVAEQAFAPPAHSVAVLAFDNLSGDPAQSYFSDGLSEQLIDSLTQISAMQVAGRASSFSFRGSHATIGAIGRALNVSAVLGGSVRHAGNRIVVAAQLTSALTGFNLWSRTYDHDQNDIANLQADIALSVAHALKVTLAPVDSERLALGGTKNAAAYDAYLRGTRLRRDARVEADFRAALAELDHAMELDPDFALCEAKRSGVLMNLASMGTNGQDSKQRLVQQALAAADHAVALAPMLGLAHMARGSVLNFGALDQAGALKEQIRAQSLTPGNAAIETNYAAAELSLGHVDQAVAAARRAVQLDPLRPDGWGQLAWILFEGHRYDEALAALDHETAITGTLPQRHRVLRSLVLLLQGHPDVARTLCAAGNGWLETQVLALADHALGQQAEAQSAFARMRAELGDGGSYNYAEVYAQWGQTEEAFAALDKAVKARDPGLVDIVQNPLLDPIRADARFKEIVTRLASADQ